MRNLLALFALALLVFAGVGWVFSLWRIGGVQRYFWAASISYLLYEDVAAREAAAGGGAT